MYSCFSEENSCHSHCKMRSMKFIQNYHNVMSIPKLNLLYAHCVNFMLYTLQCIIQVGVATGNTSTVPCPA